MRVRALLAGLLSLVLAGPADALSLPLPSPPHHPERLIVAFEPGSREAVRSLLAGVGEIVSDHPSGGWFVTTGIDRAQASAVPGVRFAEPDAVVRATGGSPSDPRWNDQWGPQKIGAPAAWERTTGSGDVVVGVVDSGADLTHPDLVMRLWRNPHEIRNGRDDDGNGFVDDIHGADCRDGDGDPRDTNGHGTHVAGIIGAAANEVGIVGVDRRARIMVLRFLGSDATGRISDAIRCLDYAIAHGVPITNHSWGTSASSVALLEALARARAAGMLVVASAGNDGRDLDATTPSHLPSSAPLDNVLAVAASTNYDALAASSNVGASSVDLAAPGVGILSTVPGGWANRSGTSVAAPHVAAAAALVLAAHPALTYAQVVWRLTGSVDRTQEMESRLWSGGRLNVVRAVEDDAAPPAVPTLHSVSPLRTLTSVTVAWVAPDEDGASAGIAPVSRYRLLIRRRGSAQWATSAGPWPAPPGTPQSARIDGLSPGTAYDVMLVAIDNVGNQAVSRSIIVSTS